MDQGRARIIAWGAALCFAVLASIAAASEAVLLQLDRTVQAVVMQARSGWLNEAMRWLTFLGTRYVIGALVIGMVWWSYRTGRHRLLVTVVVVAFAVNPLFEFVFKELVGRVRPDLARLVPGRGPSFPSGHVLASVGFYGLLPLVAWEVTRRRAAAVAAVGASVALIVGIMASRVYLDVHWTTDVVAGLALGLVLVVATYRAYLERARQGAPPETDAVLI